MKLSVYFSNLPMVLISSLSVGVNRHVIQLGQPHMCAQDREKGVSHGKLPVDNYISDCFEEIGREVEYAQNELANFRRSVRQAVR